MSDLYIKTNLIMAKFRMCPTNVRLFLFKQYCSVFYGSGTWNLDDKNLKSFQTAYRKCIKKVLDIPRNTHTYLLYEIYNTIPICNQLLKRSLKFICKTLQSENISLRLCGHLALNGSCSDVCSSISVLYRELAISKHELCHLKVNNLSNNCLNKRIPTQDHTMIERIHRIKELIEMRDNNEGFLLSRNEIADLLIIECAH